MQHIIDYFTGYWCERCGTLIDAPPKGKIYKKENPSSFTDDIGYYHEDCLEEAIKVHTEWLKSIDPEPENIVKTPKRNKL